MPAIVTCSDVIAERVSLAYFSISVTPHEEIPARNASLLVRASLGPEDESKMKCCARALFSARPGMPIERLWTVSVISWLSMEMPPHSDNHGSVFAPVLPRILLPAPSMPGAGSDFFRCVNTAHCRDASPVMMEGTRPGVCNSDRGDGLPSVPSSRLEATRAVGARHYV